MAKKEDTAEKNLQIWGERKILPLDKVKPNKGQIPGLPKNPRIIRDDKFKKLVKSIQDNPEMLSLRELLVYPYGEEYIIIGGNMRYHAIKENKYTEAPCKIIPKEATPEQLKAYMMKDNSSFGEWDFEALANEFDPDELDEWGIDVPILEEEEEEREEAKEDDYNEDDAEQAPSVCQLGDVWQLGAHRLMCGDSTSQEDIEKLMDGDLCDCYLTDPPYNVNYEGKTKEKLKIDNDTMSDGNFLAFLTDAFDAANSAMKPGASFYIWHADSEGFNFRAAAKKAGWQVRQVLVWVKNTMVLGRQDYQWKHEPCLYGWKDGAAHYFCDSRKLTTCYEDTPLEDFKKMKKEELVEILKEMTSEKVATSVIRADKPAASREHPTMKPVKLIGYQVVNSTRKHDIILDSFGGSGTTLIACEQLERRCRTMELSEHYCDVIIERWQKLTGKKAVRISRTPKQQQ